MKYIFLGLALLSAPLSAQDTKLDISLSSFEAMVEAAPSICTKARQVAGENMGVVLSKFMEERGFSLSERFIMLNLCVVYFQGEVASIRKST